LKYVLLIYLENALSKAEREQYYESAQLAQAQQAISRNRPLHAVATATGVRVRDGKLVTDGPFAETVNNWAGSS